MAAPRGSIWVVLLVTVLGVTGSARSPAMTSGAVAVAVETVAADATATATAARVHYRAPLTGALVVIHPFELPPTPYAAGHRGVDLLALAAQPVYSAAAGRVTFAGSVAGRGLVVVVHPDGISTEYEPLTPLVGSGQAVGQGEAIGRVEGTRKGCAPNGCLHWGARRDGGYLDPMSLLRPLGVVRLLPWP